MSSWGRRSPTSSKRRAQNHHGSSNRNSNSFSMHDISNSYNQVTPSKPFAHDYFQFPIYPQNRGRSPTEKTHRSRKKELNPQEKLRRQNKPRLFVALYDYDPLSQSPNDDAVEVTVLINLPITLWRLSWVSESANWLKYSEIKTKTVFSRWVFLLQ